VIWCSGQAVTPAHLDFLSTVGDYFFNSGEADPFLFQSDGRGVGVCDEVGVEGRFGRVEAVQDSGGGGRLAAQCSR